MPPPGELTPTPIHLWKPQSLENLAKTGIYTYEESDRLRERVMNPYERDAINNIIVRGVSGQSFERQCITLTELVDENMVETLGAQIKRKIWGSLVSLVISLLELLVCTCVVESLSSCSTQ